jgi:hypothetical protein
MIRPFIDYCVSIVSPERAIKRATARRVERSYRGGESNRLSANQKPKNQKTHNTHRRTTKRNQQTHTQTQLHRRNTRV